MIKIEGPRVYIRDHIETDLDAFYDWIADEQVMEHLTWKVSDHATAKIRLAESIAEARAANRSKFFFAIVDRETHEMIGDVGFTVIAGGNQGGVADLGYFLRSKFFGNGYGLEATRLIITFAFARLGLHKVVAGCAVDNRASEYLMQKLGMKKEGHFLQEYFHHGRWKDRVRYGILAADWNAKLRGVE